jgi:hypothetical protein
MNNPENIKKQREYDFGNKKALAWAAKNNK